MSAVLRPQVQVHVPTVDELARVLVLLEVLRLNAVPVLVFEGLSHSLGLPGEDGVELVGVAGRVLADKLEDVQLFLPLLAELLVVDGGLEVRQPLHQL